MDPLPNSSSRKRRLKIVVAGAVQGVGFRPFVYRLASDLRLFGWVSNDTSGVKIEVEGEKEALQQFLLALDRDKPPHARIASIEPTVLDPLGYRSFEIRQSFVGKEKGAFVLPDIATCEECRKELFDPSDRRYLYPFITCTHCGPRYSIIEALPYDRERTTMKTFSMCKECRGEYEDPLDRRFHAQPVACPECGPDVELLDEKGRRSARGEEAVLEAAAAVREGLIIAIKGLGGFHLVVVAGDAGAVARLRRRKGREEKPFALMFPDLGSVEKICIVSPMERRVLISPQSPIVLLQRKHNAGTGGPEVASNVAPQNPRLGIMLPYTPLHHILLRNLGIPIVATSGNRSEEPICTDEREALERLSGIADLFLVHDRPIARHVDDSIVEVVSGREMLLRRARGYAPLPVELPCDAGAMTALGAHLKNSVAVSLGKRVFVSQHIGDLETDEACSAFERTAVSLERLYEAEAQMLACDLHPDYYSTRWAQKSGKPLRRIQHHFAHVFSCMADNGLEGELLGVARDGTGYGTDGTVWGGEFIEVAKGGARRVGSLRGFPLPGGEKAMREPRRCALGLLYAMIGEELCERGAGKTLAAFDDKELRLMIGMMQRAVNSPVASSVGRLFDALASILGSRQVASFEAQAAMELEFLAWRSDDSKSYPLRTSTEEREEDVELLVFDWEPMIVRILEEVGAGVSPEVISTRFHNTLVEMVVEAARRFAREKVVLSGGCFQNRYLVERTMSRLEEEGFRAYIHQRVPPNDGGIALGQIAAAAWEGMGRPGVVREVGAERSAAENIEETPVERSE